MRLSWLAVVLVLLLWGCGESMISSSPDTTTRIAADSTYLAGTIGDVEWQSKDSGSSMLYTSYHSLHFRSEHLNHSQDSIRSFSVSISDLTRVGSALIQQQTGSVAISYGFTDARRFHFFHAISGMLTVTAFDTLAHGRIEGTITAKMASQFGDTIEVRDLRFGGIGFHQFQ